VGGSEDAVEARGVAAARRDQGRDRAAPGRTVGDPGRSAGWIRLAEAVLDATIGEPAQPVGRQDGSQEVACEALEPGAIGAIGFIREY
jgi:hypothetical protein